MACRAVDTPFEHGRERPRVIIKLASLNCEQRFHYAGCDIYAGLFIPNSLELIGAAAHQDLRVAAPYARALDRNIYGCRAVATWEPVADCSAGADGLVVVSNEEDLGVATARHQLVIPLSQTVRNSLSEGAAPRAAACYYRDVNAVFAIDVLDFRKSSARLAGGVSVSKEQFGWLVGVVAGEVEAGLDVAARLHAERVRDTDVAASTGAVGASGSCPRLALPSSRLHVCNQQRGTTRARELA